MGTQTRNIRQLESELTRFQELAADRSHDELAQCVRVLGMYLALYKNRFGDIPACEYEVLEGTGDVNEELQAIVTRGLEEAYAMLRLVAGGEALAGHGAMAGSRFIN